MSLPARKKKKIKAAATAIFHFHRTPKKARGREGEKKVLPSLHANGAALSLFSVCSSKLLSYSY